MADQRMECLRLAVTLANGKAIAAKEIIPLATEFYRYVDNDPEAPANPEPLAAKYRRQP